MAGKTGEKRKREREKEKKESSERRGLVVLGSGEENPSVLFCDADQESKTRMRNNALRTGPRQAVDVNGESVRRKAIFGSRAASKFSFGERERPAHRRSN
ncbi:hypothetical protein TNCV_1313311 [Trichonephila clavipes]|nr:hypothetical protein TNCV_1313311 [Trichonephila clavipes]